MLSEEKELLGAFISCHPMDSCGYAYKLKSVKPIAKIGDRYVKTIGVITNVRMVKRKKDGADMAFFTLEDKTTSISVCCFSECFNDYGRVIEDGNVVLLSGKVTIKEIASEKRKEIYAETIDLCPKERKPFAVFFEDEEARERFFELLSCYPKAYDGDGRPVYFYQKDGYDRTCRYSKADFRLADEAEKFKIPGVEITVIPMGSKYAT